MREYLTLGPVPCDEPCQQVPYEQPGLAKIECRVYIHQLKRSHGEPPEGAELRIMSNRHDFGTYLEVVVWYDVNDPAAWHYAATLENELPLRWDDAARLELANLSASYPYVEGGKQRGPRGYGNEANSPDTKEIP